MSTRNAIHRLVAGKDEVCCVRWVMGPWRYGENRRVYRSIYVRIPLLALFESAIPRGYVSPGRLRVIV